MLRTHLSNFELVCEGSLLTLRLMIDSEKEQALLLFVHHSLSADVKYFILCSVFYHELKKGERCHVNCSCF